MNRGAARQPVFFRAGDGEAFEAALADGCERTGVEVHAYALMTNHYHLLTHCPRGGLSSLMQLVSSEYTKYLNRRLGRDGPLFRGRFHSRVIDSDAYLHAAGAYIHRNPIDRPSVTRLDQYRWSSYRCYRGLACPPPWLRLDTLPEIAGGSDALREAVELQDVGPRLPAEWSIELAIAECCGLEQVPRSAIRTVATLLLGRVDGRVAAELHLLLGFPSPSAARTAASRARARQRNDPAFAKAVERALATCQGTVTSGVRHPL